MFFLEESNIKIPYSSERKKERKKGERQYGLEAAIVTIAPLRIDSSASHRELLGVRKKAYEGLGL